MLQPPGSTANRRATASGRRKTQDSPDEVIRQLQRLPANKKCADCSSKLPSCVNLTAGTFICIQCAGIHRELSARVKGVGHSSFTETEAEQLRQTDNDKVNAIYLARYDPSRERLKRPIDNTDQAILRSWIQRKYKERAWYNDSGEQQPPSTTKMAPTNLQPTVAQIPPKQKQPTVDFFGDSAATNDARSRTTAIPLQEEPAFQANFADFSTEQSFSPEPVFQADFSNFSFNQQQQDSKHNHLSDQFSPNAGTFMGQSAIANSQSVSLVAPSANVTSSAVNTNGMLTTAGTDQAVHQHRMVELAHANSGQSDVFSVQQLSHQPQGIHTPGYLTTSTESKPFVLGKVNSAKYKAGQTVYYRSGSSQGRAEILKVHFDDELVAFYTIMIDGNEKQTDDTHLSDKRPLQEEIENVLLSMNDNQLEMVRQFLSQLQASTAGSGLAQPMSTPIPTNTFSPQPMQATPLAHSPFDDLMTGYRSDGNAISAAPVPSQMQMFSTQPVATQQQVQGNFQPNAQVGVSALSQQQHHETATGISAIGTQGSYGSGIGPASSTSISFGQPQHHLQPMQGHSIDHQQVQQTHQLQAHISTLQSPKGNPFDFY